MNTELNPCDYCPMQNMCMRGYSDGNQLVADMNSGQALDRCDRLLEKLVERERREYYDAWCEYIHQYDF